MTVPNPAHDRVYPMPAPADDRRFSLGLVFDVIKVLTGHGYPAITAGGDLVALQQTLYRFLYAPPAASTPAERLAEYKQQHGLDDDTRSPAEKLLDGTHERWQRQYGTAQNDDGGFAERFLEEQRQARRAAAAAEVVSPMGDTDVPQPTNEGGSR